MRTRVDILELASRRVTQAAIAIAVVLFSAAPLLALGWIQRPFPGILVESTLVTNEASGVGWTGFEAGIIYPQRIVRIGGVAVSTPAEYDAVLRSHSVGDIISIFVELPDGPARLYPLIELIPFSTRDLVRLFWLPYLIGLAYLVIGIWIAILIGKTRPGRALAFFCIVAAVALGLIFDATTTHLFVPMWVLSIPLVGGSLISLAMRFPEEWPVVTHRPWILVLPYGIALILASLSIIEIHNVREPWTYITFWGFSYRYAALGMLFFLGVMVYNGRTGAAPIVRQQSRVVLLGSAIAFFPIILYFLAPLVNIRIPFNTVVLLPFLLVFPLAVVVAIQRFRLWEFDSLVNRAVVYGILTAVLAGFFTGLSSLSQRLFMAITGERSDASVVITTIVVMSMAAPIRVRLQSFVDRQFKGIADHVVGLRNYGDQVRTFLQMNDPELITRQLLEEAMRSFRAESAALVLYRENESPQVIALGNWRGEGVASVPIEHKGRRFGLIMIGPSAHQEEYTRHDFQVLQQVAGQVARAVHLTVEKI